MQFSDLQQLTAGEQVNTFIIHGTKADQRPEHPATINSTVKLIAEKVVFY